MSHSDLRNVDDCWARLPDPRSPSFERDLRRLRAQLLRSEARQLWNGARMKIGIGLERLGRRIRPKDDALVV